MKLESSRVSEIISVEKKTLRQEKNQISLYFTVTCFYRSSSFFRLKYKAYSVSTCF